MQELPFNNQNSIVQPTIRPEKIANYVEKIAELKGTTVIDSSLWTIDLDAVTVKQKRLSYRQKRFDDLKNTYKERGIFHFGSTPKFFAEDLFRHTPQFQDIFDLIQAAVPGVKITQGIGSPKIYLGPLSYNDVTGQLSFLSEVTLGLDGLVVHPRRINALAPESVYAIDVLKGERAMAVYGASPVIAIISKSVEATDAAISKSQDIGMEQIVHPGFYQAKTFYSPDYESPEVAKVEKDIRSTLYWQPSMR